MSTAAKQFHEEEAIGKTYDFQVARRLLRYLRPYLRLLIPALVLTLVLNLLGSLQPKFTEYAIDWYILPRKTDGLMLLVGLFFGVQFLRLIFSYLQTVLLNTVGQYVMFDIRRELYDKLQHQEVAYYDRNPVGRIMTRLTNDVDSLNELFTAGVTDVLGDVVMIVAIIGVMLWMDVRLTLVTLLTVPMLFAATTWFRKGARRGYDMVRTRIARINAFLQEHFAGAQTVQIFNAEAKSVHKFDVINDDYRKANIDTIFFYAVFFPLVDFIGAVGIALVIWYGGYRVMHGALTLGALVAFIQYSGFLFQPIRDISDKYNVLQAAVVASHRIFKTLDLPIAIKTPEKSLEVGPGPGLYRISECLVCLQRRGLGAEGRFVCRKPGTIGCARWPYGLGQNHDHKSLNALLRHPAWSHSAGRCGSAGLGPAIAARKFRGGAAGHLSLQRDRGKQHPPGT